MHDKELPKVSKTNISELGVSIVKTIVNEKISQNGLGCLFRELRTADFGIDGQIEIVENDQATGKIISVQIKSGNSYFKNNHSESWSVYIPKKTVNYWISHSVPVLLILVDTDSKKCYWTRADLETHDKEKSSYRIKVPKKQILDSSSYKKIKFISENTTEAGRKLAKLEADFPLIKSISNGSEIVVDIGHWQNKLSGRSDIVIGYGLDDPYKGNPRGMEPITSFTTLGGSGTIEFVERLFPWSKANVDIEFIESIEDELYDEYLSETGSYDKEQDKYIDIMDNFSEWFSAKIDPEYLEPYALSFGEVGFYRFKLELNELGISYLKVHKYLNNQE